MKHAKELWGCHVKMVIQPLNMLIQWDMNGIYTSGNIENMWKTNGFP
jgi:hypothetical protein